MNHRKWTMRLGFIALALSILLIIIYGLINYSYLLLIHHDSLVEPLCSGLQVLSLVMIGAVPFIHSPKSDRKWVMVAIGCFAVWNIVFYIPKELILSRILFPIYTVLFILIFFGLVPLLLIDIFILFRITIFRSRLNRSTRDLLNGLALWLSVILISGLGSFLFFVHSYTFTGSELQINNRNYYLIEENIGVTQSYYHLYNCNLSGLYCMSSQIQSVFPKFSIYSPKSRSPKLVYVSKSNQLVIKSETGEVFPLD
jgi:hypothetical protein